MKLVLKTFATLTLNINLNRGATNGLLESQVTDFHIEIEFAPKSSVPNRSHSQVSSFAVWLTLNLFSKTFVIRNESD